MNRTIFSVDAQLLKWHILVLSPLRDGNPMYIHRINSEQGDCVHPPVNPSSSRESAKLNNEFLLNVILGRGMKYYSYSSRNTQLLEVSQK